MILNGISVDYEDYYHASNLLPYLKNLSLESRIAKSLDKTLAILSENKTKATFFVLAELAEQKPSLIKLIASLGHELAAHSYSHRCIYDLTEIQFRQEAKKAKEILEQISGSKVLGFRAPNFSINAQTPWAYDVLAELGYRYDSSVYPVHHPRYSNPHQTRDMTTPATNYGDLLIVPLATYPLRMFTKQINLPLAGGAYWRLLPAWLIKAGLRQINQKEQRPHFCYFHPWELDPDQPRLIKGYSFNAWRHYGKLDKFAEILSGYLKEFSFSDYRTVLGFDSK